MKILLTGAAGGIGSTLGFVLYRAGHDLGLIDNLRNGYLENLAIAGEKFGVFQNMSVSDPRLQDIRGPYDCIIHFAGISALPDCEANPVEAIDANVAGTVNVLEYARKWNVPHTIFASTSAVYENNLESIYTEDLVVNPRLMYSLSKKMAEEVCESYRANYGLCITTLRFFNVFGPRQDIHRKNPPLLNYLVREISQGKQPILHSDGEQARDYIHVDDVISCISTCLVLRPNDTLNVCTGSLMSVNEIVKLVLEEMNSSIVPIYRDSSKLWDTYPELFDGLYPLAREVVAKETVKHARGSYRKAKRLLDWEPNTNLAELFRKTISEIAT